MNLQLHVPTSDACKNAKLTCEARKCNPDNPNDTNCYCTQCGGSCGECEGNSCSTAHLCGGNMTCQGIPDQCKYAGQCQCVKLFCPYDNNACWQPDQLGPFPGACLGDPTKK